MRRGAGALLLAAALGAGLACHREPPHAAGEGAPLPPADATYTTRGVVSALPAAAGGELVVFHEAVPEFVNRKGERSGMDSMVMPFAVAEGVALEGIERGDKVELTFELRWQGTPTLRVVELAELAPETELRIGRGPADTSTDPPAPVVTPDGADEPDGAESRGSSEAI